MKPKYFSQFVIFMLFISCPVLADRPLDRDEVLQIFQKLTSQHRKTWIPAGTIEATHQEYKAPKTTDVNEINRRIKEKIQEHQGKLYKREMTEDLQKMKLDAIPFDVRYRLSNEYRMSSTVVVRYDGQRFYWEINVGSRRDSVKPSRDLEGNFMTDKFDLSWNKRRIFAWDGEKYTTYFLPGNHAIVDTTGNTPHVVNGPLTAGLIPWGYGYHTFENLSSIESSAIERVIDSQAQIHLTLHNTDGAEIQFVLDPERDYAVISCSIRGPGNSITSKQYTDYQLVSGNWVPSTILIERYDASTNKLLASDLWNFTRISGEVPAVGSFEVKHEPDAVIEYFSNVSEKAQMYHHSQMFDTDTLLAERLTVVATEGAQPQNCATIALKYALSQLGRQITGQQLAKLINEPNNETSLYEMKQFLQRLGLYCRAVKTDIPTLKSLVGCEAILHIPGKKHFVVLEAIDDKYVWTIDLASNNFYYQTDISFFGMDWTEGTALLVSSRPITAKFIEINDSELQTIIGAAGYTCTRLLQTYNVIYCDNPVEYECGGIYQEYYTRYGCEPATSGSCKGSTMIRYAEIPCIEDPYDLLACDVTGEWTCYYMRACL